MDRESSPPYFLSKNDFVVGVVWVLFSSSDRLGVVVDGVDRPSSPYFLRRDDGVVDGVSKESFGSAGEANGEV